MNMNSRVMLSVAIAAVLSGCVTAPEPNAPLEAARAIVPQVEASPRAGVAASEIANARKSLDTANRLDESRGKRADIEYEAHIASTSAQVAQEKIRTAEANDEIAAGTAQRQVVLLQARERESQRSSAQASDARRAADASEQRADSLEAELADLKLQKTERGLVLTLGDVLFDTNQATFKPAAYGTLDRLAMALRDKATRKVLIEGHTDNIGSNESNQGLSERRAQSVQSGLSERGVTREQISSVGKGENFPVASNDSSEGRQSNRRVELIFTQDQARVATDGS
jgi:OmpA-OmpF porin, OOP family